MLCTVLRTGRGIAMHSLHRYGYTDQELLAEYSWIAALNESGLRVPQPLASIEGSPLVHVAFEDRHHQLDLVPWIEAEPLATVSTDDAGPDELRRIYTELGRLAARVHLQSRQWQVPAGFSRKAWDVEGLLGQTPLWGRFWELEALSPGQRNTVDAARAQAEIDLRQYADSPEGQASFGLIHADLVQDNVLVSDGALHLIDLMMPVLAGICLSCHGTLFRAGSRRFRPDAGVHGDRVSR